MVHKKTNVRIHLYVHALTQLYIYKYIIYRFLLERHRRVLLVERFAKLRENVGQFICVNCNLHINDKQFFCRGRCNSVHSHAHPSVMVLDSKELYSKLAF